MQFLLFSALLLSTAWSIEARKKETKSICYPEVGCFTNEAPFDDLPLPMDPTVIAPVWYKYVAGKKDPVVINSSLELDVEHLFVFIHGYTGNFANTVFWHQPITWNLLTVNPTHNLLFVEWEKGAAAGSGLQIYTQAASNSRLIGRAVINFLQKNPKFDATKVHCLGFSMGAHVCGFAGKYVSGWGRLSAMDPARPNYDKDDATARIDKTDAAFVDVIHTSLTAGMQRSVGHIDFWPNGSKRQPGCLSRRRRSPGENNPRRDSSEESEEKPEMRGITDDIEALFGCSHYRAAHLYAQTILDPSTCYFKMCPGCTSWLDWERGKCSKCDASVQSLMGYPSINFAGRGDYWGKTSGKEPFCLNEKA